MAISYPSGAGHLDLVESIRRSSPVRARDLGGPRRARSASNVIYLHFIPEIKQVAGEPLATQLLDKHVYSQPGHKWHKEGMSKEQLQKIQEFYKIRYGDQK